MSKRDMTLDIDGWNRHTDNPLLVPSESYDKHGVADPIAFELDRQLWLLYEGILEDGTGVINAAVSDDGVNFTKYDGNPVFDEYDHQSYPALFERDGYIHMTPDTPSNTVPLWRTSADSFPSGWSLVWEKPFNVRCTDPALFEYDGTMYLIVSIKLDNRVPGYFNKVLYLDDIEDSNTVREIGDIYPIDPASSTVSERSSFTIVTERRVVLYHQADEELNTGGDQVHGATIHNLSTEGFELERFRDNPVIEPIGDGWESFQIHSLSVVYWDGWYGYYDGHDSDIWSGIGLVTQGHDEE